MTPDECIELLARPFGITPTDHSFLLESAGHKARITVESNSGTLHAISVTLFGRPLPNIELTREGGFDRLGKELRIAREAQLGEAIFDAKVYVETTLTEPQVRRVLGAREVRDAVLGLFRQGDSFELGGSGVTVRILTAEAFAHDPSRLPLLLQQLAALVDALPDVSDLVAGQRVRYTPGCGLVVSWVLAFTVLAIAVSVVIPSSRLFHPGLLTVLGVVATVPVSVVFTLLVALVVRGHSRSFRETVSAGAAVFVLLLPAGPLTLAMLNSQLDRSAPETHSLEILNGEMRETDDGVELVLTFPSPLDPTDTMSESFGADHVPRPGTRVTVVTRSGGLGFAYRTETYFTE